jgi:hypothetical protein
MEAQDLDLPLSKKITICLRSHQSTVGEGSAFNLLFMADDNHDLNKATKENDDFSSKIQSNSIVEDNKMNQMIIKKMLESKGVMR